MAYDYNLTLSAAATKTATFTATAVDLKTGTPRRGLVARINYGTFGGTSPTCIVKIQDSADNTTYTDLATGTTATAAGLQFVPFSTSNRYARVIGTIGGTSPTVPVTVDLGIARP